jgi:hypothetical protein
VRDSLFVNGSNGLGERRTQHHDRFGRGSRSHLPHPHGIRPRGK